MISVLKHPRGGLERNLHLRGALAMRARLPVFEMTEQWRTPVITALERQPEKTSKACWLASPAKSMSSRFSERPCGARSGKGSEKARCLSLALRTRVVEERTDRYRLLSDFHLCVVALACPPQQMCSKQIRWRSIESHVHRLTYMCVSACVHRCKCI